MFFAGNKMPMLASSCVSRLVGLEKVANKK